MRKIILFFRNINRMWLLFALAIVLGLAAALLLSSYLKDREAVLLGEAKSKASGGPTVEVVAAGVNIARGTALGTQNLTKRAILADLVTEEMVLVSDFERVDGVKAARAIQAGWPLRVGDVIEKAKGIAEGLEEGTRAITIEVDEINSMAQMVKPGNKVDLMLIVPDGNSASEGQRVILVLQGVRVLATGQRVALANGRTAGGSGAEAERYSNFTFEVTPQNAARIALAQQMGKIRAVLRGSNDVANVELDDVSTRTMLKRPPSNYTRGSVRGSSGIGVSSRGSGGGGAQPGPVSSHSPAGAAQRFNGVEYIIGGKGSTVPVNINIPSLFPASLGDRNPFGAGASAPQVNFPPGVSDFMPPALGQPNALQRP